MQRNSRLLIWGMMEVNQFTGAKTMHRKPNLPTKICAACARPFTWRRKWALSWATVKYCSRRCRSQRLRNTA